jgi:hypothetical protein
MFRFADIKSQFFIFFGTLAAILNGSGIPLFAFFWGKMYGAFVNSDY